MGNELIWKKVKTGCYKSCVSILDININFIVRKIGSKWRGTGRNKFHRESRLFKTKREAQKHCEAIYLEEFLPN